MSDTLSPSCVKIDEHVSYVSVTLPCPRKTGEMNAIKSSFVNHEKQDNSTKMLKYNRDGDSDSL